MSNTSPNNAKQSAEPTQLERLASTSGIRNTRRAEHSASFAETLLSFLKPITWIPVIWSFVCGAVASGNFGWEGLKVDFSKSFSLIFLMVLRLNYRLKFRG